MEDFEDLAMKFLKRADKEIYDCYLQTNYKKSVLAQRCFNCDNLKKCYAINTSVSLVNSVFNERRKICQN